MRFGPVGDRRGEHPISFAFSFYALWAIFALNSLAFAHNWHRFSAEHRLWLVVAALFVSATLVNSWRQRRALESFESGGPRENDTLPTNKLRQTAYAAVSSQLMLVLFLLSLLMRFALHPS